MESCTDLVNGKTITSPEAADAREPAIAVSGLTKSFGVQCVLDGVSFKVKRGETLVVLGRSGTGKSVLLKIIVGLQKQDAGNADVLGKDVCNATVQELASIRRRIGFLFQHAALYDSMTVEENVAFPLLNHRRDMSSSERRDRVSELLRTVGLVGHSSKMPADISGGMQKRVALARALALDPMILLLDEPTAGLDPISSGEIDELIASLQTERQMASILVTHDLLSAKSIATRIILLNMGRIVIEGSFDDLRNCDDVFVSQFLHRDS